MVLVEIVVAKGVGTSVSTETGGAGVMSCANDMVMGAARMVAAKGEDGAYLQLFDAAPDDMNAEAEIGEKMLRREAARRLLSQRVEAGFVGLLGFSRFEAGDSPRLYVEVFDTRDGEQRQGTATSIALSLPLKKTWTGKYRAAAPQGVFHGEADPLGVATV